ncbi:MAG TPA: hypothetical protein VEQ63_02305, partial [Bryobacteraceae bacterium]|nr:hypothetical protein [Bryobacteraceae bacterium]
MSPSELPTAPETLPEHIRAATELLELIAADTRLLQSLSPEERERFHQAVAQVHNPDPGARRRMQRAAERERNAAQTRRATELLNETGIRALRRKPVFTTPNVFPPLGLETRDIDSGDQIEREPIEPQHCYICKQKFSV